MTKRTKAIEPEFVGVADAEVMTGRSRWSWRKDAYAGRIASVKLGRRLLIPISEIRRVLAEGMRPAICEARDNCVGMAALELKPVADPRRDPRRRL